MWRSLDEVRSQGAEVRIGKKGITEGLRKEIVKHLKDHGIVKVRILDKGSDREELARRVANEVGGELIEVRGRTFILRSFDRSGRDSLQGSSERTG